VGALRALRSAFAFLLILPLFVAAGTFQRFVLWPYFLLRPERRKPVMDRFMHVMAHAVLSTMRLGGARTLEKGHVPTAAPVLVLMNHQSLLDIPTAVSLCRPDVPLIVTRRIYGRGIPMVSPMLRIQRYPLIDPRADRRQAVAIVQETARTQEHGILLYPEGHRGHGGELGAFASAGIRVILKERHTPVYLIVTDGFWVCRRLKDFILGIHRIHGHTEVLGPFEPPAADAEVPAFVERMRETMRAKLEEMRDARSGSG
jgi:1-acyl-sn-glycerol-3-phosphate acyltransferase